MATTEEDKPFAFETRKYHPRGIDLTRDDLVNLYKKLEQRSGRTGNQELAKERWTNR